MQEDRINQRDFEKGKEDTLLEYIRMCMSGGKQFAVTPLPESVSDTRHLGWRISWPKD